MIYLGIDPGKSGAIARIDSCGVISVEPTPIENGEYNMHAMKFILHEATLLSTHAIYCIIERAQAMPKQGVVSMFEFGKGYGIWLALLASENIPFQVVHSRVWTKELLAGAPGEGKDRNIAAAKALFPTWQPKLKKELLHCDALLLAEYARRKWKGVK